MHGRSRKFLQGMARQKNARNGMRRPGPAWQGNVTQNRASLGKEGNARQGQEWHGKINKTRPSKETAGPASRCMAITGKASQGKERQGKARQGKSRQDKASPSQAGLRNAK